MQESTLYALTLVALVVLAVTAMVVVAIVISERSSPLVKVLNTVVRLLEKFLKMRL